MLAGRPISASLARIPIFAGLGQPALDLLAAAARVRRYRRGEVIFHAGDTGDSLFVIVDGEVKIALPSEKGDEAIVATLHDGEIFGEIAVLDRAPRSATATAVLATDTVVLSRERFRDLLTSEPTVRDALLLTLAGAVRRLTIQIEELHFLDITGRLAAALVRLAEDKGARRVNGGVRLRPSLTQAELASMVACTRQSANKVLGRFADEGCIRLDREGILVTDLVGLVAASRR